MIETGGWGGIAHYAWSLSQALGSAGADVCLFTARAYELADLPRRFVIDSCLANGVRYPRAAWDLLRRLAAFEPDVVHVQSLLSTRFDWSLWPVVRRLAPLVMTVHNVEPHEADPWASWTLWRCLDRADAIVVHTRESLDIARRRVGRDKRIALIHQGDYAFFEGVPTDRATARRQLRLPLGVPLVLTFGAIRPYKGILDAVSALAKVRARHEDACLVIVGPLMVGTAGEYREAIERAGVTDAVVFRPGYVPREQVASYFSAADVAVYSYREVTDSACLRLACGLGTPVVATAVGAFREFLVDGITARLVLPGDTGALADAISDVLSDPASAAARATMAHTLAASLWSWNASASSTIALYCTLAEPCHR